MTRKRNKRQTHSGERRGRLRGQSGKTAAPHVLNDPTAAHRAVFSECGLVYGKSFGSKSAYAHTHPARFYVANASVFTRDGACVWRGDLDVATASDRDGLIKASRRLRRKFYILREFSWPESQLVPRTWLATAALITVWRGSIAVAGDTKRLRGSLENLMKLSGSAASKTPRDYAEKQKGRDAWARRGSQTAHLSKNHG